MPNIDPQNLAASLRRLGVADGHDDITGAIDRAVTACVDLFGVDGSGLMIADDQNTLRYLVSSDGPGRVLEEVQSETGQGPCVDTFVHGAPVRTEDMTREERWPRSRETIVEHGVRAVMGVPVRLGGVTVGSLDVYRDHPHAWDESEQDALVRYSAVVEAALRAALAGHNATELAGQLQYALDNRVLIERAVGFLMGRGGMDAVSAFEVLRSAARSRRSKVAQVAQEVLETGRPPTRQG
ncbi:GAF and ANTAR domain-containing protein [Pseudonocardia humida]|uniref:GAF and ANTAR domain-containing protein n=1 Tax=Pseudonocardia humida TaxID=2800819 RepID=UPI00207CBEDB|nr:GAF and ANTAR domain-containing protein [Pseudonocardia humida]